MNATDAIIIGGGIGGLFTGAFLAKNGVKVTVLEKNHTIGGGLQCFTRNGKTFETGMHVMGGFEPGGVLTRICRYLGVLDRLDIQHIPSQHMDEIIYQSSGERYVIASGREAFADSLAKYFPEEAENLHKYVDRLFELTEELPLFYLKESREEFRSHSEMFTWPADRLIAHFIRNERLRELLAYLNPLYAGVKGHTPAYIHALINVLFIMGASRFAGGSQQLADALRDVIESFGGSVLINKEVASIKIEDKKISEIITSDGDSFTADWFISSIHPTALIRLTPESTFRREFIQRLDEIPNSYSAFSLYIDLASESFPYIDHTCYLLDDYGMMWNQNNVNAGGNPRAFMYMTPPDAVQGEYASKLLVHCVMNFDDVRAWANTTVGRRGSDYRDWKDMVAGKIIAKLEKLYPGLHEKISAVYSSSPLTIRDYFNTKEGAMFGYSRDCEYIIFSHLSVRTKVPNLLLTGQNVNLHGMCGVPLTAIHTAEAILGHNNLVKEINHANETV